MKDDSPKVAARARTKKSPGNRRMATVAFYTVDPHVRTAEDAVAALFRDEPDEETAQVKRPRPQNKNTTAHFPTLEDDGVGGEFPISGIHVAMAWIFSQVTARRRSGQVLLTLMDG